VSLPRLILYARTSTDDNQSPEDSKRWQISLGTSLVGGRAEISAVVHDTDVSRALPWDRRPQASRLLADMADPNRGWDGIVIGEPQRAFGNAVQYQTVAAAMEHHGVSLWVPEVGGQVDFTSEAHDIVLNIFGTMSKGERTRLKKRVRAGMTAMAGTARFLGGRPPFGYRLVSTGVPHPNPDKARWGAQLQRLEPHPEHAPTVEQIFVWRLEGVGYRTIAARLDATCVLSPSASDPGRNQHRRQAGWSIGALQAICANPRYMGTETWGRVQKTEVLIDPTNPAAGHITRRRRRDNDGIVTVPEAIPPIVSPEVWAQAQEIAAANTRHRTPFKAPNRSYALRGVIFCGHCGRRLGGEVRKSHAGSETARYVCKLRDLYPGQIAHPLKVTIAESTITPLVDEWVAEELSPARLDLRAEQLAGVDGANARERDTLDHLRNQQRVANAKLARLYELMKDPDYPIEIAKAALIEEKAKLARIEAEMAAARGVTNRSWTADDYRTALREGLGDIAGLLDVATDDEKSKLYQLLGLELTYTRTGPGCGHLAAAIRPRIEPRGAMLRVGGGT
jgi:DNA invertase Pin-like site-specific DNA recombinase